MMQRAHLTAWQSHAPWPKASQREQDLRISRSVAAIFRDPLLQEHLAMRGGTVLHKAHLAPAARYSSDIDLVLTQPLTQKELDRRLRHVLTDVAGTPADSVVDSAWLTLRNVLRPSKLLRTKYHYVPLGLQRPEELKVEVNLNEQASLYPLVNVEMATLDDEGALTRCAVRSYDIDEMLGTKTRALVQRRQGRDLFDLWHAWQLSSAGTSAHPVNPVRAMHAFNWYLEREGVKLNRAAVETIVDAHLEDKAFCADMDTLLRPGLGGYNARAAAALVKEVYFVHLTG